MSSTWSFQSSKGIFPFEEPHQKYTKVRRSELKNVYSRDAGYVRYLASFSFFSMKGCANSTRRERIQKDVSFVKRTDIEVKG